MQQEVAVQSPLTGDNGDLTISLPLIARLPVPAVRTPSAATAVDDRLNELLASPTRPPAISFAIEEMQQIAQYL